MKINRLNLLPQFQSIHNRFATEEDTSIIINLIFHFLYIIVILNHLKTNYPDEKQSDLEKIKYIIDIAKCKVRDRRTKHQSDLLEFFLDAGYEREMKYDLMYGTITAETLFYFASQFMNVKECTANEIIYYEEDIAENIYFVLLGKVRLRKLNRIKVDYLAEEYFKHLNAIKHDAFLLDKTIESNKSIFPISESINEIEDIETLITKAKILKLASLFDINAITTYLRIKKINPSKYGFDTVINGRDSIHAFYEDYSYLLTQTELFYINQLNENTKKTVSIYEYITLSEKKKLDYFGNFKLGNSIITREETAVALSNTLLIEISKRMYFGCILNDQKQFRDKELEHLHIAYFFKGIRKTLFQKYIFSELDLVEYSKDHVLFNENEQVDTLYIIKEGCVELSLLNKSLIDIKDIIAYIKSLDSKFQSEEFNDTIKLTNSPIVLMPYLRDKRNFVLMKTASDVICDWEFHYQEKSLYTARICSEKTKLYQIPLSKIRSHLEEDLNIFNLHLKEAAYNKLSSLLKRIIMIKNASIEKIDSEFTSIERKLDKQYIDMTNEFKTNINKSNEKNFQKIELKENDKTNLLSKVIVANKRASKHSRNSSMKYNTPNFIVKDNNGDIYSSLDKKKLVSTKETCESQSTYRPQLSEVITFDTNNIIKNKKNINLNIYNKIINTDTNNIMNNKNKNNNNKRHNTIAHQPVFLPRLKAILPYYKKIKKAKLLSPKVNQKTKRRVVSLDLPEDVDYFINSQKKNLNYLAIHKFYEDNKTYRSLQMSN